MDDTKIIKIEIEDSDGEYNKRRRFNLQRPCSEDQFNEITASIIAILNGSHK
jgi:hypothetical protein